MYCPNGWVGGWVDGWMSDQKDPSILLISKYVNTKDVLS